MVHLTGASTRVSRSVPHTPSGEGCQGQWDEAPASAIWGWGRPGADPQLLSALAKPKFSRNLFISVLTHPLYHSLKVKKLYT